MKASTKLIGMDNHGDYLDLITNGARFRIYLLDQNIIRIRSTFDDEFRPELSYALVKTAWEDGTDQLMADERQRVEPIRIKVMDGPGAVKTITNGRYTLTITAEPFAFTIRDWKGRVLHQDLPGRAFVEDSTGRPIHYSSMGDHDHFYGFGEKSGDLDKRRRRMRMHNTDSLGWDATRSDPLYKMIPFYIDFNEDTGLAYGLFYNNSADSVFDMDAEHSNYWLRYSYFQAEAGDIDLFFIGGPTIADVVHHYTDLTGKTAMMPLSSLGYMGSTMFYTELDKDCDKAVEDFIDTCRQNDIPCDGFFLSSGYTSGSEGKRYVFTWNKNRFPDPKGFVDHLKEKGALLAPNIKPGMLTTHPYTERMEQEEAFVKTPDGGGWQEDRFWGGPAHFVDFTSPAGRQAWANEMQEHLLTLGITSIWNDNNEYEINEDQAMVDAEGQHLPISMVKPIMSTMMAKTAQEAVKRYAPGARPYVINRAGFAGIQRYAQTWAGDNGTSWTNLKYNVPTILGMGLSGVANQGCDIGGFDGPAPDPELFVRWVQNGIFQPRFSIHSCNTDNTVTEPWMYPAYTKYISKAIQLRYSLVPYFYALLHQASVDGSPIMRPLVYEFQNDPRTCQESFEFMLGPSLLVANVLDRGVDRIQVYLPNGAEWFDLTANRYIPGGSEITVPVNLGSIPLFLRVGSIIPTCQGLANLHLDPINHLEILIEPNRKACFDLYEDDGLSMDYLKGAYRQTRISACPDEQGVTLDLESTGDFTTRVERMTLAVLSRTMAPLEVKLDGRSLDRYLNMDRFRRAASGWFFDGQTRRALVRFPNPEGDHHQVRLGFTAKDLISI